MHPLVVTHNASLSGLNEEYLIPSTMKECINHALCSRNTAQKRNCARDSRTDPIYGPKYYHQVQCLLPL